jgi:DinB family protein
MTGQRTIMSVIEDHFGRICEMWKEAIGNIPEAEWRTSDIDYLIPARHLCHVVVAADFYTGTTPVDKYDWHSFFDGDWEGMTPAELPDKAFAMQRLDEIQELVQSRFAQMDDEALGAPEAVTPWTGQTAMGKVLYWFRHFQHHLGELHSELRRRDIARAKWR